MYINFCYPVARGTNVVDDNQLRIELLGLPFVAFCDG
jgi:hypothetical protein